MRPVLMGDVVAAARVVMCLPPDQREDEVQTLLYQAHLADKVMKRIGVPHPDWGNGSLMAAAGAANAAAEPFLDNPAYVASLCAVFEALLARLNRAGCGRA